jgi:putative hemolysin
MERTLALGNQRISSLMTYRTDIVTLDVNMTVSAIEEVIQKAPFVTYPVVDGDIENVLGLVTLKDIVTRMNKPGFSLRDNMLQPLYLPENITVYKALEHLKRSHYHVALICDEFGAVEGIITFRDIFEGLVGNITEQSEEPDIGTIDSWLSFRRDGAHQDSGLVKTHFQHRCLSPWRRNLQMDNAYPAALLPDSPRPLHVLLVSADP